MAITKKILAEQAFRIIQGGSVRDDADMDIRELMLAVEQERDKLIKMELFQYLQMGDYNINGSFISTYIVPIYTDTVKDLQYSDVPVTPISLPHDMGLYQVSHIQDQHNTFVRMHNGALGLYNGLPSANLLGRKGYWVEAALNFACDDNSSGTRIYYNDNVEHCDKGILLKVVATSGDIKEDEPFPIAPEMESTIVRSVVELYTVMKNALADEQNDNID